MFSFFKKKKPVQEAVPEIAPVIAPALASEVVSNVAPGVASNVAFKAAPIHEMAALASMMVEDAAAPSDATLELAPDAAPESEAVANAATVDSTATTVTTNSANPTQEKPARLSWAARLAQGLRRTGSSITQVFVSAKIDDDLYDELEAALLMADAGVHATQALLLDLKKRVKAHRPADAQGVKVLLAQAIADLLSPLEKALVIGAHEPTVVMVVGVNGAGKTTSIGKLTQHLGQNQQKVLLAAADTFRAAAREQLAVWADRNTVQIISQEGADPSAVTFDAVVAGKARGCDVVIADTAGRLPTQLHLMEELKKIKRVIDRAMTGAPHEVLLVVDGNTGQNALAQVKAFDDALGLTGLIVTKLDGTAKGGVLAAIARERPIPVYFIGIGEGLNDLQAFNAQEFAQALLG